ncbi:hypothetical protein EIN_061140 [Entamoeba invadens IP1]|uniref:hypothetical protein n=1 Tax=Entamoeba invadens IP1 TaxID=370355 RepID=UPI0002C3F0DA|nr:hypothetical protein EIN_061140 [Entamoeba invadens IP1]ELP93549.1 hypothetical protein EIN_061140 [Entamoeba invadens IP1]|eukprot:XP_004260320.1 hypothetical protein EIN_061140 [Entamoeba invadens IP1]
MLSTRRKQPEESIIEINIDKVFAYNGITNPKSYYTVETDSGGYFIHCDTKSNEVYALYFHPTLRHQVSVKDSWGCIHVVRVSQPGYWAVAHAKKRFAKLSPAYYP